MPTPAAEEAIPISTFGNLDTPMQTATPPISEVAEEKLTGARPKRTTLPVSASTLAVIDAVKRKHARRN